MTRMKHMTGRSPFVLNLLRALFVGAVAVGGVFVFAASAAFAFFIIAGLVVFGLVVYAFLWARAKLFGRPFGPQAQFEKAKADFENRFRPGQETSQGPIIEARQTPDGWSVDH